MKVYIRLMAFLLSGYILPIQVDCQAIVDVVLGTNNVSITEVQLTHDGNTYTQNSGANSTTVTALPVMLNYIKISDAPGDTTILSFANTHGTQIRNSNFTTSTTGIGIYKEGSTTLASNATTFNPAVEDAFKNRDLVNFLYYDPPMSAPAGDDLDLVFAKGVDSSDYFLVAERWGNTYFSLKPIDENGNLITTANTLRFGFVAGTSSGNGTNKFDWDIGYAPSNLAQSMVYTVIKASLFNTGAQRVYGFRIDNFQDADIKFLGVSDNSFLDNDSNLNMGGISGNIFNDSDGLVDGIVNGSGISNVEGTQLYASLIDSATALVIESVPVAADGSYEFLAIDSITYSLVVSENQGVAGNTAPIIQLPTNWISTGEYTSTSSGDDGNPNGEQIQLVVNSLLRTNINFGIEKLPASDSFDLAISTPTYNSYIILGQDGTSELAGKDFEDGLLGSGNNLVITGLPTNGNELWYNGIKITDGDSPGPASPTNPYTISNYNPALLSIKFTGLNSSTTSFNYAFIDTAGEIDNSAALYTLNYGTVLPVEWMYFKVELAEKGAAIIKWGTASESNTGHFLIQKSLDGSTFRTISTQPAQGFSFSANTYYHYDNKLTNGKTYYRVAAIDLDESIDYTSVEVIQFDASDFNQYVIYPNPVLDNTSNLNVKVLSEKESSKIQIFSLYGQKMLTSNYAIIPNEWNVLEMDISTLGKGTYFLKESSTRAAKKFVIH